MSAVVPTEPYWDEAKRDSEFTIGVDLGQAQDYTAICILERFIQPIREIDRETGKQKTVVKYEVRHLERPPLGTPYPAIVERVAALLHSPELHRWERKRFRNGDRDVVHIKPELVIDKTGVGAPLADIFKAAKLNPVCVTITSGNTQTQPAHRDFHVPKRDLVSALQVAFQNRDLKIAQSLPLSATLATELQNFRLKINIATAHDSYEAWREGQHDDLVLCVALAFWWSAIEKRRHQGGMYRAIWGANGLRIGEKIG